jgi:hypothetical protein
MRREEVVESVQKGLRPAFKAATPQPYAQLARSCWDQDPAARPSMPQVVSALKAMIRGLEREPGPEAPRTPQPRPPPLRQVSLSAARCP